MLYKLIGSICAFSIINPVFRINRHYRTGETLPDHVVEAFCATKQVFSAVDVHTQLFYSLLDQRFHGDTRTDSSGTTDVLAALHAEHHPLGYPERTAWHHRFSHLVGYGARDGYNPVSLDCKLTNQDE